MCVKILFPNFLHSIPSITGKNSIGEYFMDIENNFPHSCSNLTLFLIHVLLSHSILMFNFNLIVNQVIVSGQ